MMRRTMFGTVLVVMALGVGALATSRAAKQPPDFHGRWRFDPSKSDAPNRPEGMGGPGGARGSGGGWRGGSRGGGGMGSGGRGGMGGGGRGGEGRPEGSGEGGGMRRMRLPDFFSIQQEAQSIRIADSTGIVMEEIVTGSAAKDAKTGDAAREIGHWSGDRLTVERQSPRGGTISETLSLADDGRTLIIRTTMGATGDRPAREFKRVYLRQSGS
jgi:hypothetical protein